MAGVHEKYPAKKKKPIKLYASHVFQESSVNPVASFVSTKSVPRKLFLIIMFLLFLSGFLYQCINFFVYVFTYPTVVNIEITKPDRYMTPAYTFCNYNKIKRSKFCGKYPENCINSTYEFCEQHTLYCGSNQTMMPKEEYYTTTYTYNEYDVLQMGHDLSDLLAEHGHGHGKQPRDPFYRISEDLAGPYPRKRGREFEEYSGCFTMFGRASSPLDPYQKERDKLWHESAIRMGFNAEEDELFNPYSEAGILFTAHSPLDAVNPFQNGIFMKPGHFYKITVTMQEEALLPAPYKTDCMDYIKNWEKNNRTGPRTQSMCKDICLIEFGYHCHNCTHKSSVYPHTYRICRKDEIGVCTNAEKSVNELMFDLKNCLTNCKDDCLKLKYIVQVQERTIPPQWENKTMTKESRYIRVEVDIDDKEVISIRYRPQFQEEETFSNIGGFIGIWLGISLAHLADVFESTFRILRYFFRKGTSIFHKRSPAVANDDLQP